MAEKQPRSAPAAPGSPAPAETVQPPEGVRSTFEGRVIGTFTLLVGIASLLLGENLVFLMACLALGLLLAARLSVAANLRGLSARREAPQRARVGVPVPVHYELGNPRGRGAVGIEIHDRRGPTARPVDLALEFPYVPRRQSRRHTARFVYLRRGRQRLARVRLHTRFPLGLFEAARRAGKEHDVLVRPREGRATGRLSAFVAGRAQARRRPSPTTRGLDAFHGVREYREGDDPRRIHWRTTARTGALALAEWHREEGLDLVVVLGRGRGAGGGATRDFERAVSTAATLLRLAHTQRLNVRLVLGHQGAARGEGGAGGLGRALDALAVVPAQGGRRPRGALRSLARQRQARVVVYVAAADEAGIQGRLKAAAGPGGSPLVLRADQPSLARWVRGLP